VLSPVCRISTTTSQCFVIMLAGSARTHMYFYSGHRRRIAANNEVNRERRLCTSASSAKHAVGWSSLPAKSLFISHLLNSAWLRNQYFGRREESNCSLNVPIICFHRSNEDHCHPVPALTGRLHLVMLPRPPPAVSPIADIGGKTRFQLKTQL